MKSNQKCVRMSDEVLEYVNKFHGNGFNQKFENIVLYFRKTETEQKKRLNTLNREISKCQETIRELNDQISDLQEIKYSINTIKSDIQALHKRAQRVIVKCAAGSPASKT